MSTIAANLHSLIARMHAAAATAYRAPNSIQLIAVSKFHPASSVREALVAGHRVFGENRVQEAKAKFPALRAEYPDLELHLIGPLQSNKAEDAVRLFDVIHTIDRPSVADAVAKAMRKTSRSPRLYLEINIGAEPQKTGLLPEQLDAFLTACRDAYGLKICGLMCIPPQAKDPTPHFLHLADLAHRHHLPHLSMGMSSDFESAIRAGATEIRIGTALFGERPPSLQG